MHLQAPSTSSFLPSISFLPPSFPPTVIYTLSGWAVRLHLRDPGPLSLFLPPKFFNPRSKSWYSALTQKPQIKPRIIFVCFSSILHCLFSFCRLLSRLSPAATLPISVIFALLLSSFWSFESPLSSISHHPPCRCVAAAMFWVRNSRRKTRWLSLTHIHPTDLASDANGLLLCAVKSR